LARVLVSALIVACLAAITATSVLATSTAERTTAKKQYYHADGYIKAIGKNARRTIYHPDPRIKHRWRRDLRYLIRVRHRAYTILHPPPPVVPQVVSHIAMWLCIHSKEGDWAANTGNGYYGGLQMMSGWGGVSRPDLLSPSAQIALAERGYAQSGYSLSWIRQQWPRTSYGCV
jgi:hypothetical protein